MPTAFAGSPASRARLHTQTGRSAAPTRGCRPRGQDRPAGDYRSPIYIQLSYFVVRIIALCLNSPSPLVFVLEDQINAAIPTPSTRIVFPQPDFIYLSCPLGIVL